jgi:diguanylate cyclase (GGDEF)-like protein
VLVEIDKFKQVNDRYGHLRGDAVLRAVAEAMKKVCRTMDVAARSGGDEFVLLLPQTPKISAARVAERLRHQLELQPFPDDIRLTASLGIAAMPNDESAAESLLEAADRAMYQVKRAGGNRVGLA